LVEGKKDSQAVLIKKWQVIYYLIPAQQGAKQNLLLLLWKVSVGNWISAGTQICMKVLFTTTDLYQGSSRVTAEEGDITRLIHKTAE